LGFGFLGERVSQNHVKFGEPQDIKSDREKYQKNKEIRIPRLKTLTRRSISVLPPQFQRTSTTKSV